MTKFLKLEQKMREKCHDLFDNTDLSDAIRGTFSNAEGEVEYVRDAVWQMIILALYEAKEEGLV